MCREWTRESAEGAKPTVPTPILPYSHTPVPSHSPTPIPPSDHWRVWLALKDGDRVLGCLTFGSSFGTDAFSPEINDALARLRAEIEKKVKECEPWRFEQKAAKGC